MVPLRVVEGMDEEQEDKGLPRETMEPIEMGVVCREGSKHSLTTLETMEEVEEEVVDTNNKEVCMHVYIIMYS